MYEDLYFLLVFILILVGMFLIFWDSLAGQEKQINVSFNKTMAKAKRTKINAETALNGYEKIWLRIDALLLRLKKKRKYFFTVLMIFFCSGIIAGFMCFRDILLSLISGIIFMPLSYLFIMFRAQGATRKELEELENTMAIITNAYMGNDDIVRSVETYIKEKNKYDEGSIKITPFDEFVSDIVLINPNVERGLDILARKINNKHFYEWVKVLILCSKDRRLKFALQPIVDAMGDEKRMQIESDTLMSATWRNYLATVAAMFSIIPTLRMAQESWYLILTQTLLGKMFIILMMVTALITGGYVMWINKPINTL
ncbi:MAG: hypothetical protein PHE79_11660 [Eubacteriales bacterium]|nr:hypothetical protein [Eubacteriales bacterium]